jgi:hypothetical protein
VSTREFEQNLVLCRSSGAQELGVPPAPVRGTPAGLIRS